MPDEIRAVRMADLPEIYQAPQEGGQGESSGPSFLSQFNPIADSMSRAALRQIDRPIYDSQPRSEVLRWSADTYSARPLTFADLQQTWTAVKSFRETTRERGEQMRFSGQPDPLTEEDKRKLEVFYAAVLKNGYGQYPLNKDKISLYLNGTHKRIFGDPRWGIQSEYIYIGYSQDQGSEDFAEPMYRLACISALMGITGHANKPELIALLSERLAKVMAGVYDTVVKPLATTSDSRPVRRMAWSTGGGLATWLDGAWIGMTGEPVAVGPDWVVVDTNEGSVEDGLPAVGAVGAALNSAPSAEPTPLTHAQWVEIKERFDVYSSGWRSHTLADGRRAVGFYERETCERHIRDYELLGCIVVDTSSGDGDWAITYPPVPLQRNVETEQPLF